MTKYYIANIKRLNEVSTRSVSWARRCLDPKNEKFIFRFDGHPRIPIFYGKLTAEEIRDPLKNTLKGRGKSESTSFINVASNECSWASTRIAIVDEGVVWVVSPAGSIEEFNHDLIPEMRENDSMKCFRVNILTRIKQQDAPFILASQKVNRYYSSGTFVELQNANTWPNKLAIESVVPEKNNEFISELLKNMRSPIELLSSSELETLIARVLEEHGFYVASRVPGGLQNIDIIGWNDNSGDVNLNGLEVGLGASVSIQVKRGDFNFNKTKDVGIDYFFATGDAESGSHLKVIGLDWLESVLKISPVSKAWLERSISWARDFL
jgi:hypothetical protein